ncbi:FtsW/RodA/SpoVE family cell cycle protein [Nocardioides convexus]|uniref:FtsW/RodA/SpoVE family cell cycle protein n=1 Tax=Nocardioides convexus TaxID=2712224 RepID=UPI0024184EC5|nr:FtsW/RodA/SpoVE family cell cycle protein [Nocardioides convexus]
MLALGLAATDGERLARIYNFADPFKDYHGTGWQPAHGLYAMASGGIFGEGIGASQQKWGQAAGGAHRLHLRGAGRGAWD